jgi:hypothetical protein
MGCDCSVTRNDVTLMDDGTMVAYATIESRCEPARLENPSPESAERQRHDSGVFGCRVTYVIKNADLNLPAQMVVSRFAAGAFSKTFAPPLGPGQSKTLSYNTSTAGGDCRKEATGQVTLTNPDGSGETVLGGVPVCVGVSRT